MLYVKANPAVVEEQLEIPTMEVDDNMLLESVMDVDMALADAAFITSHMMLESYEANVVLEMNDANEQSKKDVEAGNVEDAETSEGKPAAASTEQKKGILQRIKAILQNLWDKAKDLFNKFVNWITSKIESTDKFIAKFNGKKLGRIKVNTYDYAEVFKRIKKTNEDGKNLFNLAKKGMDEVIAKGKAAGDNKDYINEIADTANKYKDDIDEFIKTAELGLNSSGNDKNLSEAVREHLLGEKKEREYSGDELMNILKANKDIKQSLEKLSVSFFEHSKFSVKYTQNCEQFVISILGFTSAKFNVVANFALYGVHKGMAMMSQSISVSQKMIMAIRNNINECAKASEAAPAN